jgi:hypothetical protein
MRDIAEYAASVLIVMAALSLCYWAVVMVGH